MLSCSSRASIRAARALAIRGPASTHEVIRTQPPFLPRSEPADRSRIPRPANRIRDSTITGHKLSPIFSTPETRGRTSPESGRWAVSRYRTRDRTPPFFRAVNPSKTGFSYNSWLFNVMKFVVLDRKRCTVHGRRRLFSSCRSDEDVPYRWFR